MAIPDPLLLPKIDASAPRNLLELVKKHRGKGQKDCEEIATNYAAKKAKFKLSLSWSSAGGNYTSQIGKGKGKGMGKVKGNAKAKVGEAAGKDKKRAAAGVDESPRLKKVKKGGDIHG